MIDYTEIVWVEASRPLCSSARGSQVFEDCLMGRLVIWTPFSSTFQVETFTEPTAQGDSSHLSATIWPGAIDSGPFEQVYLTHMDHNPFLGI